MTIADPTDLFFFSPSSNKTLLAQLLSANNDYELELYLVDWDNMVLYNTGIVKANNQLLVLTDLPIGDYALEIRSKGSVGDNYDYFRKDNTKTNRHG